MTGTPPTYREIVPPPDLAELVACCWVSRGSFAAASKPVLARVLPDGCMDILITLGDFPQAVDGKDNRHRAFVVGTMTQVQVFALGGTVDLIAVRFKPGGVGPFLQVPADELVNMGAPLEALLLGSPRSAAWQLESMPSAVWPSASTPRAATL